MRSRRSVRFWREVNVEQNRPTSSQGEVVSSSSQQHLLAMRRGCASQSDGN
jgi:hypothetical protein